MAHQTRYAFWLLIAAMPLIAQEKPPQRAFRGTADTASAQESVLYSFRGSTGFHPYYAALAVDASGNLYGTTPEGGAHSGGTAFELSPMLGGGWTETVLHNFANKSGKDGNDPQSNLVFDDSGNLYGTTDAGGAYGLGTVFELTPTGRGGWTEKVLHDFSLNNGDGNSPAAGLVFDTLGNLYGTTAYGGDHGSGTVFELSFASGHWRETVLHSFDNDGTDGFFPAAALTLDPSGNLYGTTPFGGSEYGIVFQLSPTVGGIWTESILHNFIGSPTDGSNPEGSLIFDASGNLYGTTSGGGPYGGTVFELTPVAGGTWTETVLHDFVGGPTDGNNPYGTLIFDGSGNLYGTTAGGGAFEFGTVFELTPTAGGGWMETTLNNFTRTGEDGYKPYTGLVFDAAGNLFGTTRDGGAYSKGTVFEITFAAKNAPTNR